MFYEGLNLLQANLKSKKQTFARKLMCQAPSYALIFPIQVYESIKTFTDDETGLCFK